MSSHRDDGAELLLPATRSAPGAPTPGGRREPLARGSSPHDLAGKVAVVTGADNAIGAATALALAARRVNVLLVGRQEEQLHALAGQVRVAGGRAEIVAADVTDKTQAQHAVERAAHAFGRLDILVNNAGLALLGPATDEIDWHSMIDADVLGMVHTTHAAVPYMGAGSIVTISSAPREVLDLELSTIPGGKAFGAWLRQHALMGSVRATTMQPDMTTPVPWVAARRRIQPMSALRPEDIAQAVIFVVQLPALIYLDSLELRSADQVAQSQ